VSIAKKTPYCRTGKVAPFGTVSIPKAIIPQAIIPNFSTNSPEFLSAEIRNRISFHYFRMNSIYYESSP